MKIATETTNLQYKRNPRLIFRGSHKSKGRTA